MTHTLQFLRVFALGTWVGSIIYFVAVVTRDAFAVLPNRDLAGALVGSTLGGLHGVGIIVAVVFLIASVALRKSARALIEPAVLGVILMLLLTLASQRFVIPRMADLRREMVSVNATPGNDPRRAEFDRLHRVSVDLEGGVLLIGLAALFLTVKSISPRSDP